jgi:hypothetical protein
VFPVRQAERAMKRLFGNRAQVPESSPGCGWFTQENGTASAVPPYELRKERRNSPGHLAAASNTVRATRAELGLAVAR